MEHHRRLDISQPAVEDGAQEWAEQRQMLSFSNNGKAGRLGADQEHHKRSLLENLLTIQQHPGGVGVPAASPW